MDKVPNAFRELLLRAKGSRNQSEFAMHCQVDPAIISRALKQERLPSPATIKKIANRAYDGVTFEQLMAAAGYIDDKSVIHADIEQPPYVYVPKKEAFFEGLDELAMVSNDWTEKNGYKCR